MTVREVEARMDSAEFAEWLAFEQAYGIPDGYFVTGQVCSVVANAFAGAGLGPEAFVPYFRRPRREQTPEEARAIVRAHLDAVRRRKGE